jgi:hypothetical protein
VGFSHIAWALSQVTKGGCKAKFVWGRSQQKSFDDMKHHLCSAPMLTLLDLQQPFEIETMLLIMLLVSFHSTWSSMVAYHSETLSDVIHKYPTYDKEMYSIIQAYRQWKHYILGKETIIHMDHKPL